MSSSDSDAEDNAMYDSLRSEITRRLKDLAKGPPFSDSSGFYGRKQLPNADVVIYRTIDQVFREHRDDIDDYENMNERMKAEDFSASYKSDLSRKTPRSPRKQARTGKQKRCPNGSRRNKAGVCVPTKNKNKSQNKNKTKNKKKKPLKPCPPGKARNPKTNRCRKIVGPKGPKGPKGPSSMFPMKVLGPDGKYYIVPVNMGPKKASRRRRRI